MVESYFIDIKFFEEDGVLKEAMPTAISSTRKCSVNNAKETCAPPEDGADGNTKPERQREEVN